MDRMIVYQRVCGTVSVALLLIFFSGCARPRIDYTLLTKPGGADPVVQRIANSSSEDYNDTYAIQRSILTVNAPPAGKSEISYTIERGEDSSGVFAFTAGSHYGVTTNINLKKVENTNLFSSVDVEVKDDRITYINAAGKVVTTIVGLALGNAAPNPDDLQVSQLPLRIDLQPIIVQHDTDIAANKLKAGNFISITNNGQIVQGLQIQIGDLPPDAREISEMAKGPSGSFIYTACRPAVIKAQFQGATVLQPVRIADARYIQTIGLPEKGTLTAHSQCGMSAVEQVATLSTSPEVLAAAVAQAAAIIAVVDKKK